MSSYIGHAPAFLSSLERQPFGPTKTTVDHLQLDSLASRMLGARTQGRHGRGGAGPRQAERGIKGGICEELWAGDGDGEKGFAPISAHL